ncbi:dormancy-associated protein homolog 3-like isoform X1 [Syzygium oleosum]|uniref:dormancy-associated protein homolog 3-like isoform X1 n=1 Tax=Syzygium oleosum TaxID=219896 RepID=UPI0024BA84A4|nr:dormancy-associated protein homolog 3-like isoform X1 [Syzygium oleosum]
MSLLDHLWDDTVAGPTPESGLGKLRKHSSFSSRSNSGKESAAATARSYGGGDEAPSEATRKVTRSITIARPPGYQSGSPPASPAGSVTPGSPFSESPFGSGEDLRRTRMRRQAKLDQKAPLLFKSSDI